MPETTESLRENDPIFARLEDQIGWYDRHSRSAQKIFKRIKIVEILSAALIPFLAVLPFSQEKIGSLLRYVICHEVGHTLGLQHNFKASIAYSVKQLRDPEFMKTHGTAASIPSVMSGALARIVTFPSSSPWARVR